VVGVRTDEPDLRFVVGASLDAGPTADGDTEPDQVLRVTAKRWHSGQLLIAFAGITDRTAPGALTGLAGVGSMAAADRRPGRVP
jgi:16S rRNA processing protein RimM